MPLVNEQLGWYGKADLLRVGAETGTERGDEIVDFKQWDAIRVPAGVWRCFEAGPDGAEVLDYQTVSGVPTVELGVGGLKLRGHIDTGNSIGAFILPVLEAGVDHLPRRPDVMREGVLENRSGHANSMAAAPPAGGSPPPPGRSWPAARPCP